MPQTEAQLEAELIDQLNLLGYQRFAVKGESDLINNLRTTLADINGIARFSDDEWQQIISHLTTGTIFDKANILRDKLPVKFDDGNSRHIYFLSDDPTQNRYQISNQITVDHTSSNGRTSRFDVTILINGLPLVQIELKRRSMEIAEAFHQTRRYSREAYSAGYGLFGFIQLFISNGVNTRYYANGTKNIEFAFAWADITNKQINEITDFATSFLTPTHLTKMLTQYMILMSTTKSLMVMRPYQIYAVENIIQHINSNNNNGYIWHTTGSGKTLTSFKASQLIMNMPDIAKVLFVVDRNDLDTQTATEFNNFRADSVDSTNNTKTLVRQLGQQHDKLIVTTLQKLNNAISKDHYSDNIAYLKDQKVVFIFDECHRSQFGDTHKRIKQFFNKAQMFGFTGTPIFEKNSTSKAGLKLTTNYLFDKCLHQYVIVDAIRDKNVLPFQIDYLGRYTQKGMEKSKDTNTELTAEQVEAVDTKEVLEDPKRLKMIARHIIDTYPTKTKHGEFTAMFCVGSVEVLTQYYELFKQVQAEKQAEDEAQGKIFKPLTIATIFSYAANEAVETLDGLLDEESADIPTQINQSSRDKLDSYIADYNATFATNYNSGDSYYAYYRDIATRVRNKQIDVLMVVNMFLTGFDAKTLNTLYVDKNLKHHGLLQAFSRTNRVLNEKKPFGNIVCYRNLKFATDQALSLFSNKDKAKEVVIIPDFEVILEKYEAAVKALKTIVATYQDVDDLYTEAQQLSFIQAFRDVMRLHTQLQTFSEYDQDNTSLDKQEFANYASKYSDLKNGLTTGGDKSKTSILEDIDFQLDLLHSDRVNVGYIVKLLQLAKDSKDKNQQQQYRKQVQDILNNDITLYDKQELIQKFIDENLPTMPNGQTVEEAFKNFWDVEKEAAYQKICVEENLKVETMQKVIQNYEYTKRLPRKDELKDLPNYKVGLFQRENVLSNLLNKTHQLINRFYMGL
nr:type I restriction endonuclease subunit R [Moraxella osloensis]